MRVLIIEDDEKIARFVELELKYENYDVEISGDGRYGLELALSGRFDLVLLDIMLPGLVGTEVLRRLRKSSDVPVIMITARDGLPDKISGLDLGADDYITKPFEIEELLARIRAATRRKHTKTSEDNLLTCGDVLLDSKARTVTYSGEFIDLTKREFDLLEYLMRRKGEVVSRDKLLADVWDFDFDGGTNTVDVYVRFLRAKIDDRFGIKLLHTVRGVGYAVREDSGGDV